MFPSISEGGGDCPSLAIQTGIKYLIFTKGECQDVYSLHVYRTYTDDDNGTITEPDAGERRRSQQTYRRLSSLWKQWAARTDARRDARQGTIVTWSLCPTLARSHWEAAASHRRRRRLPGGIAPSHLLHQCPVDCPNLGSSRWRAHAHPLTDSAPAAAPPVWGANVPLVGRRTVD